MTNVMKLGVMFTVLLSLGRNTFAINCRDTENIFAHEVYLGAWQGRCYMHQRGTKLRYTCETGVFVPIKSAEFQNFVISKLLQKTVPRAFATFDAGAEDIDGGGDWRYPDGTPVTWTNFGPEPGEGRHALIASFETHWRKTDLDTGTVVCEVEPEKPEETIPPILTTEPEEMIPPILTTEFAAVTTEDSTDVPGTSTIPNTTLKTRNARRRRPRTFNPGPSYRTFKVGRKNTYISAVEGSILREGYSVVQCCSQCSRNADCVVVNYTKKGKQCRLFTDPNVFKNDDGFEFREGWDIWTHV